MDTRPYCFQTAHPLSFAVQLRLSPELKQALVNARSSGDAVSLRFREEPHREAVLSIAGQEYFFATAPQAGQVEVVELTTLSKGAVAVAAVKQRLTLQRDPEPQPRRVGSGLAGGLHEERLKKRSAVLLDGGQRGPGRHPRVTTTTEVVTRSAPQTTPPQGGHGSGPSSITGRLNGTANPTLTHSITQMRSAGSGPSGPHSRTSGPSSLTGQHPEPLRKAMELPKPRSQQQGAGAAGPPKPLQAPSRRRKTTPTPPPPDASGGGGGGGVSQAPGLYDSKPAGGGGGGSGNSPVGQGGGGGGVAAATATTPPLIAPAAPIELPRAAVLAARRGALPLVFVALLREQPLTGSSLVGRIDAAYRAAGMKPEAREYVRRVMDNCCTMAANRMHIKPDVLAREGPRLDELVADASPTGDTSAGAAGSTAGGGRAGRNGSGAAGGLWASGGAAGGGGGSKRVASCSPDPWTSPDPSPISAAAVRSGDDGGVSGGGADGDEDTSLRVSPSQHAAAGAGGSAGLPRGGGAVRHGPAGAKRQRMSTVLGQRPGAGRAGSGGGGSLKGYDDFDDLADPTPMASAAPAPAPSRDGSAGRPVGQYHAGQAAAAKASVASASAAAAAAAVRPMVAPGGPRGLPSHNSATLPPAPLLVFPAAKPSQLPSGPQSGLTSRPTSRPKAPSVKDGGSESAGGGGSRSPLTVRPAAARQAVSEEVADVVGGAVISGAAGGADGGDRGCTASESVMTDTITAVTMNGDAAVAACGEVPTSNGGGPGATSPAPVDSTLDPELLLYKELDELQEEDKDAEWYRPYVDWKPEPHAAVQSYEQFEQYEREYRSKFEAYYRLNQKYSEVVREAEEQRAAVEGAGSEEDRRASVLRLWRLGASKWRLLEVWKQARRNLHADLGDLRDRGAEYVAKQGGAG